MNIIEQNESVIKELAEKISNKQKYPEVKISFTEAYNIIKDYMKASLMLKTHYNGTTSIEASQLLGNVFTKIIYLNQKGLLSEKDVTKENFDVALRDKIWVTLSLIREFALKSERYEVIHKPYKYTVEQKTIVPEQKTVIPEQKTIVPEQKSVPNELWWLIGAGALLLLM